MDEAETDVLAYMTFPAQHRAKLHSTNPLERLNGEIKRRTEVVEDISALLDEIVEVEAGSCPLEWCSWRCQRALRHGRADQSAKGRPMTGSSATGAMVSRVM